MSIPSWKKVEMEKGKKSEPEKVELQKPSEPQKIELKKPELRRTISLSIGNTTAINKPMANNKSAVPDKVVFKVPRDPRLTRSVTHSGSIIRVVQNDVLETTETSVSAPVQIAPQVALPSILVDTNTASRIPVKERLGVRSNANYSNPTLAARPTLFSNESNPTPFVIPKNQPSKALDSTFLANRINQPISSNVDPRKAPAPILAKELPNVAQQSAPTPSTTPLMPAFALNPVRKKVVLLTLPSFASGPQQYEPVFTYLFKKTCRRFMSDTCQNPNECQLEHRLPDHDYFRTSLDKMFQSSVIDLYENYMCRNDKLFNFYIEDFCKYFGKNNLTDTLKQMVEDCNERHVAFHFTAIVEGLMSTGQSFTKALAEVISSVHYRSVKTSEAIVKLILKKENENIRPFISTLDSIARQNKFKFKVEWMNRLLQIYNEKNVHELNETIWHIVNAEKDMVVKFDADQITKFMDTFARLKTQSN